MFVDSKLITQCSRGTTSKVGKDMDQLSIACDVKGKGYINYL